MLPYGKDCISKYINLLVEDGFCEIRAKTVLDKLCEVSETEFVKMDEITPLDCWTKTAAFTSFLTKETQTQYYRRMGASESVITLVQQDSKAFGSIAEKIISEIFSFNPRTSSEHDAIYNGKKIEIKAARYWSSKDQCKWQHLEPNHDYEYVLFALLDFHKWKLWCIKKSDLLELRDKKVVNNQGKQGLWTQKSDILPYLTPIYTVDDLSKYIV